MRFLSKCAATLMVMLLAAALAAPAMATNAPAFKRYPQTVDAPFVKDLVDGKTKGYLFDARPYQKKYLQGHIPGAVNLPASQFDKQAAKLPKDKGALIVFYCEGLTCSLSHKAAFKAQEMGYSNVKVYDEGYPEWKKLYGAGVVGPDPVAKAAPAFKAFPVIVEASAVKEVLDGKTVGLVIDARPKAKKFDKGHIPGALSMPDSSFEKMKGLLPADKGALIIFYCEGLTCSLSHKSAFKAREMGYSNVKVYAKGYPEWKKLYGAGVASASAPAAAKQTKGGLKPGKEEGSVDIAFFQQTLANKPGSIHVVDVRDAGEFKAGHIKGSVNIPVDQLEKNLDQLPQDKPVVFVCGTGARSGEAYYMVKDKRPAMKLVYYVDGEITFNPDGSCKISPPK